MLAASLLVVAAALQRCHSSESPVVSTSNVTEFACRTNARHFDVKAYYRSVHSTSVRVANSSFSGQCIVNVALAASLEKRQPELSQPLLLVKVERLRLNSPENSFYVSMSNPIRRTDDYCGAAYCGATYLWASQSVELYLYVRDSSKVLASYVADFVLTEATNVCRLASRSGELLVQSSEYAFAPDSKHTQLPPNNVTCAPDLEYSLTIRSSASSSSLNVTVLACPTNDRCETLLINGCNCSHWTKFASALPGSPVTLHYVLRYCSDYRTFAGFVVSAAVYASAEQPLTAVAANSRSTRTSTADNRATSRPTNQAAHTTSSSSSVRISSAAAGRRTHANGTNRARATVTAMSLRRCLTTARLVTSAAITSSSADATPERRLDQSPAGKELNVTVVAASVATAAATALATGVAVAIICRRRLRSASQKVPVRAVLQARSTASASGEEIAMLDNDLYGVTLASTTAAHQ